MKVKTKGELVTARANRRHHPPGARKPHIYWNGMRWVHTFRHTPEATFSARWHMLVCAWCNAMNAWRSGRPANYFLHWPKV